MWEGWSMVLATVATDLQQLGQALAADLIGWGAAVIGIALTECAVIWVLRLIRA
jgi:hypothetical protein